MYQDYLKRKEKVIITAIEILDEGGIHGLTTKELAKREGITEPAIYKQFESKQDIILAVIERFSIFDEVIINTILEQKMTPREGILYFSESYASYYQNYPQITTVLFSFDVFRYEKKANSRMVEIMGRRCEFIASLVQKGKEDKEFEADIETEVFAEMIIGIIWSTTFNWKLDGCKTELKKLMMTKLQWVLGQAKAKK